MDLPIACTLAPGELRVRADDLAQLAARSLRTREPTPNGERLTFARGADVERDLRAVITAEAECCPFLRMELTCTPDSFVLDISGPPEARPVIAQLFA